MAIQSFVEFTIDVKGDFTETQFSGLFSAKTKLSQRDFLKQDEMRRSILGPSQGDASEDARAIAHCISYLSTRIVKSPDWWKTLDSGLNCEDQNVIVEIYTKCMEAVDGEYKKFVDEGKKAKEELKHT